MKRTKLVRKTPLGRGKGFKPSNSKLSKKQVGFNSTLRSGGEIARSYRGNRIRGNSMTGAGRSDADIAFHGRLVHEGCVACRVGGLVTEHPLQIHHVMGRNKGSAGDFSEQYAICLCAEHHDQRIYSGYFGEKGFVPVRPGVPSVHSAKSRFTDLYGTEDLLVHMCYEQLNLRPAWLSSLEWRQFRLAVTHNEKELFLREILRPGWVRERRAVISAPGHDPVPPHLY